MYRPSPLVPATDALVGSPAVGICPGSTPINCATLSMLIDTVAQVMNEPAISSSAPIPPTTAGRMLGFEPDVDMTLPLLAIR